LYQIHEHVCQQQRADHRKTGPDSETLAGLSAD
jgi:hypothetical protein